MITTLALAGTLCWLTAGGLAIRSVQARDRLLAEQDAVVAGQQAALDLREQELAQARALLREVKARLLARPATGGPAL